YTWYNTPNLRFLSIKDFREFCKARHITIEQELAIGCNARIYFWRNLFANVAIFSIRKS
ncbi:MAG: methionine biosynthesis protein MetW, partial [Candidatus Omnitrophica bacterium]|nr:methionine biosynthesis protein MetW [Candidatus Omnitrophota bacterium]